MFNKCLWKEGKEEVKEEREEGGKERREEDISRYLFFLIRDMVYGYFLFRLLFEGFI